MAIPILIILGLAFGSFVNAYVYRFYVTQSGKPDDDSQNIHKNISIASLSPFKGRSVCFHCGKTLQPIDLLPVISWFLLRGKCRYCGIKIPDNPLPEILTPILFVVSFVFWPFVFNDPLGYVVFALWLLIIILLVALLVYDLKWMKLPHRMTTKLIVLSLLFVVIRATVEQDIFILANALLGALVVGGTFQLLFMYSKGKWIGGGDIRLGYALGLLAGGVLNGLVLLFVSSLLGILFSVLSQIGKKGSFLQSKIPYGPSLIVAGIISVLFNQMILDWYINIIIATSPVIL